MPSHRRVASVRHGKLKRPHPVLTLLKVLLAIVAVVTVSAGSVAAIAVYNLDRQLKDNAVALDTTPEPAPTATDPTEKPKPVEIGSFDGGANILLVGSDSGQGNAAYGVRGASLNDVNILVHINEDHSGMSVISFPRDTFVNIPECTNPDTGAVRAASSGTKINEALGRGGLACVVSTVESLTGASIPYAGLIEFDGVVEMSNAVGGVTVCINEDINDKYTGLHVAAGEQTLQGSDALAFLRTRHGVGDGSDLGRISNQQVFLSALIRSIKSDSTLNDPSKLYALANATAQNVVLSTSLTGIDTMVSLAKTMREIPLDRIAFIQYPTAVTTLGSQSGVLPITDAASALMTAVLNDDPLALTGGTAPGQIGSIVTGVVPDVPVAPAVPETSTPSATPSPSTPVVPEAQPKEPVALPSQVTGQTANQVTCSNAN